MLSVPVSVADRLLEKNKQRPLLRPTSILISCVCSCIVLVALDSWFFTVFAPLLSFQCWHCLLRVEHSVWTAQRTVHHLCGSSTCTATGHSEPAVKLWSHVFIYLNSSNQAMIQISCNGFQHYFSNLFKSFCHLLTVKYGSKHVDLQYDSLYHRWKQCEYKLSLVRGYSLPSFCEIEA